MKATKVLVLTTSAQEYPGAGGRTRILAQVDIAKQGGYQCMLLCLVPLRKWLRPASLLRARKELKKVSGSEVLYFPLWPMRTGLHSLARWLSGIVVAIMCFLNGAGIVHAHGVLAGWIALAVRRLARGVRVYVDFHGAAAAEYQYRSGDRARKEVLTRIRRMEKECIQEADHISVVSRALAAYLSRAHETEVHASIVPCGTRTLLLDGMARPYMRRALGVADRFVFVYCGSDRPYQCIDKMAELYRRLSGVREDVFLLVLTSHVESIRKVLVAADVNLASVRVISGTHEEVSRYLVAADCGFLLRERCEINEVAAPTKFAEYLMCGVPVIFTPGIGDYSELAIRWNVGFLWGEDDDLERLLEWMRDVENARDAWSERCRKCCIDCLAWETLGKKVLEAYAKLSSVR